MWRFPWGPSRREENFQRILVVVTRQIGDVLLTTPLIRAAKQRWPDARIDLLGFAGTLGMVRGNPDIHELIEVHPGSTWRQSWPLIRRLWRRYDLALIAQYTDRAHLYGWVAAPVRSGQVPVEWGPSWWKRALLRHAVALRGEGEHMVLGKMRLLDPWLPSASALAVVPPPATDLPQGLAAALSERRYVVVQVPSLVAYKQWPLGNYQALVRDLLARGVSVVLTGGPSEADRAAVGEVHASSPAAINVCGQLDLNQMVRLLSGAALYVGPDTSITHLAAACAVPVLALFGPIDPQLWGPWPSPWAAAQPYVRRGPRQQRGNVLLLQGDQSCVPCNAAGCDRHPGSRSACLDQMSAQRVLGEALAILKMPAADNP